MAEPLGMLKLEIVRAILSIKAALHLAIARDLLWLHESFTYVEFTQNGANPFA